MSELLILRGVPGAGKSTFAKSQIGWTRVNRDEIRFTMYGKYWGVNEDAVTAAENAMIDAALGAGENVVLDATNLRNKNLNAKLSLASAHGANVVFKDFPVSLETAIQRDKARGEAGERAVGSGVITSFFKRYRVNVDTGVLPLAPQPLPEFEKYVGNPNLPDTFLFDIDGTLANHEGVRNPYDPTKYHLDTVHNHVAMVFDRIMNLTNVVVLSGRDADYRSQTAKWLRDNGLGDYTALYMRPEGDKRMDAIVKYELFKKYIETEFNVLGVFDDRPQVIRMWRSIGVPVFDCGNGKEF